MENMIVFKRCGNYLIYLQKLPDITITNENRESLKNVSKEQKLHAKYRANKLLILKIEHLWEKEKDEILITIDKIKNTIFPEKRLTYKVGEIIEELEFDENLEKICSQGIHYYLDKDTAKFCMNSPITKGNFSGEAIEYHENGSIWTKSHYIQGKEDGKYEVWYENGNIYIRGTYIQEKLNGKYKEWHVNGNLHIKCNYIQGKLEGEYKEWYNGNLYIKCMYIQEKLNGKYERWYENGNLYEKCTYIQGKEDGKHEKWYENGNFYERYTCIQGKKDGNYERWGESGNIREKITYSKGKIISTEIL